MTSRSDSEVPDPRQSPHFKAFEAQLAALRPREDRLDREKLMFLAGQASVGSGDALRLSAARRWAWPASIGTLFGAAAAAAVMLIARPLPTNDVVTRPKAPQRAASVVAKSDPSTHPVPFDFALPRGVLEERLLTAGMTLARTPRLLVVAEPRTAADETPAEAPAIQPSLTTRSLRELLATNPAGAFSS